MDDEDARHRTTLYRLFGDADALLYVGIAGNPGRRFEQHAKKKMWWGEVVRIELEHYEERLLAVEAERQAVRDERPLYNVVHSVSVVVGTHDRVHFPCTACGQLIDGPGHLEVDERELQDFRRLLTAWKDDHPDGELMSLGGLMSMPELVKWQAYHWNCDPDLARPGYSIDIQRIRTTREVIAWTAHLMEKAWLADTNWIELLHVVGAGLPK